MTVWMSGSIGYYDPVIESYPDGYEQNGLILNNMRHLQSLFVLHPLIKQVTRGTHAPNSFFLNVWETRILSSHYTFRFSVFEIYINCLESQRVWKCGLLGPIIQLQQMFSVLSDIFWTTSKSYLFIVFKFIFVLGV